MKFSHWTIVPKKLLFFFEGEVVSGLDAEADEGLEDAGAGLGVLLILVVAVA